MANIILCERCNSAFVLGEGHSCSPSVIGKPSDAVDHPSHYNQGGVEVIDAIEAWGLGFNLGNAVKYVARAGKKGGPEKLLEDLRKARWYLEREIERRQRGDQ